MAIPGPGRSWEDFPRRPAILETMVPVLISLLLALATALLVLLVASVAGGRSTGTGEFLGHLRSGLRRGERRRGPGLLAETRREHAEVADVEPSSVDDLFTIGQEQPQGYVEVEELTQTLSRAKERAVRGVSQIARR